jgi:hypothetical protein
MLFEALDAEQFRPDWLIGGYGARVSHLKAIAIAKAHGLSPRLLDPRTDIGEFYCATGRAQPGIMSHT